MNAYVIGALAGLAYILFVVLRARLGVRRANRKAAQAAVQAWQEEQARSAESDAPAEAAEAIEQTETVAPPEADEQTETVAQPEANEQTEATEPVEPAKPTKASAEDTPMESDAPDAPWALSLGELPSSGDRVTLGRWPQGEDGALKPILWRVLKADGERCLLLSERVLDMQPFHDADGVTRWEDCALRRWLGESFLETAFDDDERARIRPGGEEPAPDSRAMYREMGLELVTEALPDRVFLLSSDDIARYFPEGRRLFYPGSAAEATPWVRHNWPQECDPLCWWLRSTMQDTPMAMIISPVDSMGASLIRADNRNGVRPALWLSRA